MSRVTVLAKQHFFGDLIVGHMGAIRIIIPTTMTIPAVLVAWTIRVTKMVPMRRRMMRQI